MRVACKKIEDENVCRKLFGINLAPITEQVSELLVEADVFRTYPGTQESCRSEIRQINKNIRRRSTPSFSPQNHSASVWRCTQLPFHNLFPVNS